MNKKFYQILWYVLFVLLGIFVWQEYTSNQYKVVPHINQTPVKFQPQERIMILAPHPDDEVLACGGIIQEALKEKLPLKIVFFTYGDNNEWSFLFYRKHLVVMPKAVQSMGLIRRSEAIEAAKVFGVDPNNLIFLGYPDFSTLKIWYRHWNHRPPSESMLTNVSAVPYENAYRFGAEYKGDEILKDLEAVISEFKPTKIYVSHPADHNSDHKALYLFTRVALWDLEKDVHPSIYPYLIHYQKWPIPRGYFPQKELSPPSYFRNSVDWINIWLNPEYVRLNRVAIQKHRSQFISSQKYLLSFIRPNELFGDFPVIKLGDKLSPSELILDEKETAEEPEFEAFTQEQEVLMGKVKCSVFLQNQNLVFVLRTDRYFPKTLGISLFLFGYRSDMPFPSMPKIQIKVGTKNHKVLDQNKFLPSKTITVDRTLNEWRIYVPLANIGNPEKILLGLHTRKFVLPLDWVSWRIMEINQ